MDETRELRRQVALNSDYDVIVAGGGPAGCAAAIAAAREGARTLLLEGTGCLGGMGTAGLVPAWCPFSDGEKMIYRGLAERVFLESQKGVPHEPKSKLDWVAINPEYLKRVYDEMVLDAGVDVLFFSAVCGVEMRDDATVDAVVVANKGGLTAYRGALFVDATGDGDIAAWAGARFDQGDPETGALQPATHCFVLSNVNTFGYVHGTGPQCRAGNSPAQRIVASGRYPEVGDSHFCQNLLGPDTVGFNSGHLWDVDATNPESLTKAMVDGRRLADAFQRGLADVDPTAFGGAFLVSTGALMGIRETRRIVCDYTLTADDYIERRSFEDEIARNCYFIDIHGARPASREAATKRNNLDAGPKKIERYKDGESHGIPYRTLLPEGLRNVIVSGRSISADRTVQGSIRVMPVCLATGEAAGMAAGLALRDHDCDIHAVDTENLRKRLREEGAWLP